MRTYEVTGSPLALQDSIHPIMDSLEYVRPSSAITGSSMNPFVMLSRNSTGTQSDSICITRCSNSFSLLSMGSFSLWLVMLTSLCPRISMAWSTVLFAQVSKSAFSSAPFASFATPSAMTLM